MDEETQKEIQRIFELLPEDIQQVIISDETQEKIDHIATEYNILEKRNILMNEVEMVLSNIEDLDDLPKNLAENLGVDPQIAEQISRQIHSLILEPVMFSLEEIHGERRIDELQERVDVAVADSPRASTVSGNQDGFHSPPQAFQGARSFATPARQDRPSFSQPAPRYPAQPQNSPAHDPYDPMPITVTAEPERKPLIDTTLSSRVNMARQDADMSPGYARPADFDPQVPGRPQQARNETPHPIQDRSPVDTYQDQAPKALRDGDRYIGNDPYRETPE